MTKKTAKRTRGGGQAVRTPGRAKLVEGVKTASSYDAKMKRLDTILNRLDNSETSIDELGKDVKEGVQLIKELTEKLNEVDTEVRDAFNDLDASVPTANAETATDDEDE